MSAPLVVLLYDRTFVAGSFAAAWRGRGNYSTLAWRRLGCLWIYLVASLGGNRGGSTGFGAGVSWWDYLLIQFPAIVHYLRLVVWPDPLVFEYGPVPIHPLGLAFSAALVIGLLVLTGVGLVRRSSSAFWGVWFFAILAPTSLVPGAIQMISEHRMYLASFAVITLAVVAADAGLDRWAHPYGRSLAGLTAGVIAGVFAGVTFERNHDYRSALSLWSDTVAKRPAHALACYNLANELSKSPDGVAEALAQYGEALKLNARLPLVHYNMAVLLEALPDKAFEAVDHYRQAVAIDPTYGAAYNNLAAALVRQGRPNEAVADFEEALRLNPSSSAISSNLGTTFFLCGRFSDAMDSYQRALRIEPDDPSTERNLGLALQKLGRDAEAQAHFGRAARLEEPGQTARP